MKSVDTISIIDGNDYNVSLTAYIEQVLGGAGRRREFVLILIMLNW